MMCLALASAVITPTSVIIAQTPQTQSGSGAVLPADVIRKLGRDPDHDQRLKRFLDAMTPEQRVHSTLYDEYYAGDVLDNAVRGVHTSSSHDSSSKEVPPTGVMTDLRGLTCGSDGVFLGRIVSAVSNPTAKGSYLFTDYKFQLEEVLKRPAGLKGTLGSTITITRPGGELAVEGKIARVWQPSFPPLKLHSRYVVFGHFLQSTTGAIQVKDPKGMLEIVDANLRRLRLETSVETSKDTPDPRETVALSAFSDEVKRVHCR